MYLNEASIDESVCFLYDFINRRKEKEIWIQKHLENLLRNVEKRNI